jgi:hypothetical protein
MLCMRKTSAVCSKAKLGEGNIRRDAKGFGSNYFFADEERRDRAMTKSITHQAGEPFFNSLLQHPLVATDNGRSRRAVLPFRP